MSGPPEGSFGAIEAIFEIPTLSRDMGVPHFPLGFFVAKLMGGISKTALMAPNKNSWWTLMPNFQSLSFSVKAVGGVGCFGVCMSTFSI